MIETDITAIINIYHKLYLNYIYIFDTLYFGKVVLIVLAIIDKMSGKIKNKILRDNKFLMLSYLILENYCATINLYTYLYYYKKWREEEWINQFNHLYNATKFTENFRKWTMRNLKKRIIKTNHVDHFDSSTVKNIKQRTEIIIYHFIYFNIKIILLL